MTTTTPFVSVIMPVRNEADFIERSLGTVLQQDYPHEQMEILIADGMSDDRTREIINQMAASADIPVTIIDNPGRIVPTGFNAAMRQAKGEIIVRVDGHCEIEPDYVSQSVRHLQEGEAVGVGGPIETISDNEVGQAIALAMSSKFGVGGSAFRTVKDKAMYTDTIAFPAYNRKVMDEIGLLDEEFMRNQDDEYNYRIRSRGHKLLLTPDVRSRYYSRSSLKKLFRQYYQYGIYKVRVMQKHPQQMRPRQFVPVLFVSALIGAAILSPFTVIGRILLLLVVGSYLVANLAATFITARDENQKHRAQLPIIFAVLHVSYGLGFLRGLLKFYNRWGDQGEAPTKYA